MTGMHVSESNDPTKANGESDSPFSSKPRAVTISGAMNFPEVRNTAHRFRPYLVEPF